jgi:hypothetical protein
MRARGGQSVQSEQYQFCLILGIFFIKMKKMFCKRDETKSMMSSGKKFKENL